MIMFFLITSIVVNVILIILLCVAGYYLYKFAKIIFLIEDVLGDTLDSLNNLRNSTEELLKLQIFFDSPEVKRSMEELLNKFKLTQHEISRIINNFTSLSKQKYEIYIKETEVKDNE